MNKRAILKELLNGNPEPLQKLVPLYDLERSSLDELEAIRFHRMVDKAESERITNKAFRKPLKQMTEAELFKISDVEPIELKNLSDDELRQIIQGNENK